MEKDMAHHKDLEGVQAYNVGESNYAEHKIQPWDIWHEHPELNPWECDLIKRILRTKKGESRLQDYKKMRHIIDYLIVREEE